MKSVLTDILKGMTLPINRGDDTVGVYRLSDSVCEKIADELIKNGVQLPTFRIGDIVWVYDFMWGVIPCEVDRPYHCRCGKEGSCTFEMCFEESDIGTYVFATKEDAENVAWTAKARKDYLND